jgi:DNA-binding MarR family transcriptional regulator
MASRTPLPGASADPERLAWWRAFDAAHARTETLLRRALAEQHDLSLAWFRLLDALGQQSGPQVLGDLSAHLGVALSSVSRQIDRLEQHEWITTRRGSSQDHRHVVVQLTPAGKEVLKRATTTVRQTLRKQVLTQIDPADLAVEVDLAQRVAHSVD